MSAKRSSGVLLPLFSLPGGHGIGDMGPAAYGFVDCLAGMSQRMWHMLPLHPVRPAGYSPYSAISAMAGEPMYISLDRLVEDGLLDRSDLADAPAFEPGRVDYDRVRAFKYAMLARACRRLDRAPSALQDAFAGFRHDHAPWLGPFCEFIAMDEHFATDSWLDWPSGARHRRASAMKRLVDRLAERIAQAAFRQFLFHEQWHALRRHCRSRQIRIVGDIPLFVAHHSADVWQAPQLWKLDARGRPRVVAGVPRIAGSPEGQLWGNPIYDWDRHAADGWAWWMERIDASLELYDVIRFDHFRGLLSCWEIPAGKPAPDGAYVDVPGDELLGAIHRRLDHLPLIPEVLGDVTPEVLGLVDRWDLPHMRMLLLGFYENAADSIDAVHNYPEHCVAFTGNHDMSPCRGWFDATGEVQRRMLRTALGRPGRAGTIHRDLVRMLMMSVARKVVVPVQDVLGLDDRARINVPGTTKGNWQWRLQRSLPQSRTRWVTEMTHRFGRA